MTTCTALVGTVIRVPGGRLYVLGADGGWGGYEAYGKPLYLLLNFAVSLKML